MVEILPFEIFQNVFFSCIKAFLLVLGTCPMALQDLAIVFLAVGWDACLDILLCVTDLQSSHSVDVVGS